MVASTQTLTPAQQDQYEARERYRESLRQENPISGAKLGTEFGRTERWGQKRIEEVKKASLIPTAPMLPEFSEQSLPPMTPPNAETEDGPERRWWHLRKNHKARAPKPFRTAKPSRAARVVERPVNPQRRGASGVAWLAFGLGIIISVSANVGHIWFVSKPSAEALVSAMVFAAFWPVALAVAVEVLSRVTWPAAFRWPGLLGTVLVGGVALVVSYRHMNGLLTYFGESTLSAALGPVGVDGLLIVGGFALLAIGETKKRVR
jgi:hypothetical protein